MKKRLLAMLLALCLVIGLLPVSAFATGETYEKITSADEFTTGTYVMVTSAGYAPTTFDSSSSWVLTAQPTIENDIVTDANGGVWTLTVTDSTVTIVDANGTSIAPKGGNNNGIKSGSYNWDWTCANGTFTFKGTGSDTVTFASNIQTGSSGGQNRFRAYKNTTVSSNKNQYLTEFTLYKLTETTGGDTPSTCAHANQTTTTVDATCTATGSITVTCDDCSATISTETTDAIGHANGDADAACDVCGLVLNFTAGTYVIYDVATNKALTALDASASYGYMSGTDYDGSTTPTDCVFKLVDNGDHTYKLIDSNDRYVYMTGTYTNFNVAAEEPAEGAAWELYLADGGYYITNVLTKKSIGYSSSYSSFGSYANGSGNTVQQLVYIDPNACNHDWIDATCTTPKTCTICTKTEGEALGHTTTSITGEGYTYDQCSICSDISNVVAEADATLPLAAAIALGASKAHNEYTADKYYVTGTITEVYNTKYGNMYIKDTDGNILTVYGSYGSDGADRYDALTNKPVADDTITVYGIIGQFGGTPQMKNAWIVDPCSHAYDDNCDWDCNICSEYRDPPHTLTSYTEADIPTNCLEEGHPGYWTCDDCGAYCKNADGTGVLNPGWMYYYGEHTAPEDTPDCAEYTCTLCKESVRGGGTCVAPEGTPECQNSTCVNCGGTIYGRGHTYATDEDGNYVTSLCQPGECVYCGEQLEKIYDCENNTWAPCIYDGECAYGCGKVYPATGEHEVDDPCEGGYCWMCWQLIAPWHVYSSDCDTTCDNCDNGTRETETAHEYFYACDAYCMNCGELTNEEAAHSLTHVPAVAGTDCQTWDGNVEYWYCSDCGGCWLDETCTQTTNRRSVVCTGEHSYFYACDAVCQVCNEETKEVTHNIEHVEETCYNVEYWTCSICGGVWTDEALTLNSNRMRVIKYPATHDLEHVEETCYNVEYWYCDACQIVWADEALTQITNLKNVIKAEPSHKLVHEAESCYNTENWYCEICETVWADEALTQITNHKNVIKAEATHTLEHVAESCYNVEYWYCSACETVWTNEALTQISNLKNVIKAEPTHKLTHVEESCYNVEHWYCEACQTVWANEALTQITNHKNVVKAEATHTLEHVAESCYNTEYWYCSACETVWTNEALTQISNLKNVIKAEPTHKLTHVEESCYNVEHWYCEACQTVWANEALTQITNHKNVIKAEATHTLEHVAESCYNTEYWYCSACETVWINEALTQISNLKNVIKAEPTHKLTHVEESCYNVEHWYCEACQTVWANEALTQITNHKNVIKAEATHKLVHVKAATGTCKTPGNVEYWYCEACQTVWADEALTQITNHKNVLTNYTDHAYSSVVDGSCDCCEINRENTEDRITMDMYRMYNPNTGEHLYTGSTVECDNLVAAGWKYEGVAFTFAANTGAPVYRLYDPATGEHLYTMDEAEKAELIAAGWNYEGVAFNSAYDTEVPQYRLHNPNATCGAYLFTSSAEERDALIEAGWEYQGIGFYSSWN